MQRVWELNCVEGHKSDEDSRTIAISTDHGVTFTLPEYGELLRERALGLWKMDPAIHRVVKSCVENLRPVSLSPNGRLFATGDKYNKVHIRDVATMRIEHSLKQEFNSLYGLRFSNDSKLLAAFCSNGPTWLWDLTRGENLLNEEEVEGSDLASFSPDSSLVAFANVDGVRIWDVAIGEELLALRCSAAGPGLERPVSFSPDNRLVALGHQCTIIIQDLVTKSQSRLKGHKDTVHELVFSPDGQLMPSASWELSVRIWNLAAGVQVNEICTGGVILGHLAFSDCGTYLVTDRGILILPGTVGLPSHIYASRRWIQRSGKDMLLIHPEWRDSIGFVAGDEVAYNNGIGGISILRLDSSLPWTIKS